MSEEKQSTPLTTLELQYMVTSPAWGQEASKDFRKKVSNIVYVKDEKGEYVKDEKGNIYIEQNSLWDLLSMYTRDVRLSNLSRIDGEIEYVRYYLDLAGDLLNAGYKKGFVTALKLAITIMETSQAKGGFLRRQLNTLRQEQQQEILEPKKKAFFGGSKK